MNTITPAATVVIPAHNSASRLPIPLQGLAGQRAPAGLFEVVVIDNASDDDTAVVAANHPAAAELKGRGFDCRVVREEKKGLTHARIRGVLEARGRFVCFLDDDNRPCPDYVARAVAVFEADPRVGLLISRVSPQHEAPPPASVARREHLLAINHALGDAAKVWGPDATDLIPALGAGLWVRRDVFLDVVPWRESGQLQTDRLGRSLASGGDIELGLLIARAGFLCTYRPELEVTHVLPVSRQRTGYFCRLIEGIIRSELTLRKRYLGTRYGLGARLKGLGHLALAALAGPVLLLRPDGPRELVFVLADRWARVRGPFPDRPGDGASS